MLADVLAVRPEYGGDSGSGGIGEFLVGHITKPAFMEGIIQQDFDKGNGLHGLCLLIPADYMSGGGHRFWFPTLEDFALS